MKILEGKHDHNITKILKGCLFGLVMILPFLAILPSTLYFAFNEHAQNYTHEEVIETYEYETNEVNSVDDLVVGNIYQLKIENTSSSVFTTEQFFSPSKIYLNNLIIVNTGDMRPSSGSTPTISFRTDFARCYYFEIENNNDLYYNGFTFNTTYTIVDYDIYFIHNQYIQLDILIDFISASDYLGEKNVEVVSSEQSPLNAFNTASNNIWNMPIFNWVNNGLGSIAIANMLSVFGIAQNTFISNILIYWLSITTIYIIIDIIITAFTILTHLLTKKAE